MACAKITDLNNLFLRASRHHKDLRPLFHGAFHDAAKDDDALIGIIYAIKDQRLQRCGRASLGSRNLLHDLLKHLIDVDAVLRRDQRRILRFDADHVLDLLDYTLRLCAGQVDLIDDGKDVQVMIQRQIHVCQRLCLNALRRIHDQDGAVTRRE